MPKISSSMKHYEILDVISQMIFFIIFFWKISVRFQCLSSPVHMPIFMDVLQAVMKKNCMKLEKHGFSVIPCIGQKLYSVSAAAGVHPVLQFHDPSEQKKEHNLLYLKLQCSTCYHFDQQNMAYISMCIWLSFYVNIVSKILNWMLLTIFIFSRNPLITEDHVVSKVPQNMAFLSNKMKIDIFRKNPPTRCHISPEAMPYKA